MASGKFEDYSHEQLQKMVASGAPDKISTHAETLESAARIIAQASTYVSSVVSKLEWKGEAAQAYQSWATQFAKEGQKLSEYAQTVGTALNTAGQALNETKSGMPNAGSESAWREEVAASPGAEVSREKARQEAIQRLERLDSYYSVASEQIRDIKEPTFNARSMDFPPANAGGGGGSGIAHGGSQQHLANPHPAGSPPQLPSESSSAPSQTQRALPTVEPGNILPDDQVGTDLDSAGTVTDTRPSPSGNLPPQPTPNGSQSTPNSPAFSVPTSTPPPVVGRPGGGGTGSYQPGGSTNNPSGATRAGSKSPQPPASPGIHGGRASYLPTPPTQAGMARGTVIGAEPGPHGRPAGAGLAPGMGSGAPAARGESQQGVRGTSKTPGAAVQPSPSHNSSRREFTPGGTGLVQGGAASGSSQPAGQPRRGERNDGQRPDYLRENASTWGTTRRRIVPPVID